MEKFGDKARAFVYALLVHLACIALMFVGLFWTHAAAPISLPGPVIEAELVGITAAPKPTTPKRPRPAPPKPAQQPPEPVKPESKPDEPNEPQRSDAIERERIAELAQQKAEQAKRAELERHKQEQVKLEQEKKEAAERERQKQLEDIRRQREVAEKKRKLEEKRLAQLEDANKKPVRTPAQAVPEAEQARTGAAGSDESQRAQYYAAIQNAVTENWLRPDNTPPGLRCMLRIVQIPGGDVLSVEIANPCNADPLTRNSIEQAVKRAAPLPYKGYEKEFTREIRFNFSYDG